MFNKKIFKEDLTKFLEDFLIISEKNSDKLTYYDINWPTFFSNGLRPSGVSASCKPCQPAVS